MDSDNFMNTEESSDWAAGPSDLERLKILWKNEKAAPDILECDNNLVERVTETIADMEEREAALGKSAMDIQLAEIYAMDRQRLLYLLRSYLRTRIQKIEAHVIHYAGNPTLFDRLSEAEKQFAEEYVDVMEQHFDRSALTRLPAKYESMMKQSETSEGNDMSPEPQLDKFVCCKCKQDVGTILLTEEENESIDMGKGDIFILRYRSIARLLQFGQVDLF